MSNLSDRIKYDASRGVWRVLFNGKEVEQDFKTSADAYTHLVSLKNPKPTP
jgi:hypothetical protein